MLPGKVTCLDLPKCSLGEGPHWDCESKTLLYVDINNRSVHRWSPISNELNSTVVKGVPSVGAVVPRSNGGLVVAAGHKFAFLDETTGDIETVHEIETEKLGTRFNDGKCDPAGRFWAGTMGAEEKPAEPVYGQGVLYCLDKDGSVNEKLPKGIDISNGLSWTSDSTVMYYTDSLKFTVDAFDYDVTSGSISNRREVVRFDRDTEGIPDGHCIDVDGNLWVALYFGSGLVKVDPRTGRKVGSIKVSGTCRQTTSVCFGGDDMNEMFVTSATSMTSAGDHDQGGRLFKITGTGAKGPTPNIYHG